MHRIDTSTATSENKFTDGDSSQGIAATALNAAWFNSVQEELCKVIEGMGITLSSSDNTQLLAALKLLGSLNVKNVSGTSYAAESGTGSSVLFFSSASNITITGTFQANAMLAIFVPWKNSNGSSITVSINGGSFVLKKDRAAVIVLDSAGTYSASGYNVLVNRSNNTGEVSFTDVEAENVDAESIVSQDWVNLDGSDEDEGRKFQLTANWRKSGQVKHVVNTTNSAISFVSYYSTDAYRTVTIPAHEYRDFLWLGEQALNGLNYYCVLYVD